MPPQRRRVELGNRVVAPRRPRRSERRGRWSTAAAAGGEDPTAARRVSSALYRSGGTSSTPRARSCVHGRICLSMLPRCSRSTPRRRASRPPARRACVPECTPGDHRRSVSPRARRAPPPTGRLVRRRALAGTGGLRGRAVAGGGGGHRPCSKDSHGVPRARQWGDPSGRGDCRRRRARCPSGPRLEGHRDSLLVGPAAPASRPSATVHAGRRPPAVGRVASWTRSG
jgi:hypothetical protein